MYDKFFRKVFDEEKQYGIAESERIVRSPYVLKCLARTFAGMRDSDVYFVIGRGNSGKSSICNLASLAFGNFCSTVNLGSFASKDGEKKKKLMWLVNAKYARFIYANEDKNKALDAGTLKQFSGQTDKYKGLSLYEKPQEFNHLANLWAFCNTHPKISGPKSAEFYQKRDRTIETEFQYEIGDEYEELKYLAYVKKADPKLEDFCERTYVQEAFVAFVVKAFVPNVADVSIPKCVRQNRKEWTN